MITPRIDGAGDAEFVFQQTEKVNLLIVAVDIVFLIGFESLVMGFFHDSCIQSKSITKMILQNISSPKK